MGLSRGGKASTWCVCVAAGVGGVLGRRDMGAWLR